jgi:hypothetical protein
MIDNLNPALVGALAGAVVPLLIAVVGGIFKFSTTRAEATKLTSEASQGDAAAAEVFTRLAAEWTIRADARVRTLEERILDLIGAIESLTEAVEGVTPILERVTPLEDPELLGKVIQLHQASRNARRIAI